MQLSNDILIRIVIFLLGIGGFTVAWHINNQKKKKMPLVCPMHFDCNTVVHSDYSKFMGMPVELAGMIYYALITLAYFFLIFTQSTMPAMLSSSLMALSLVAFLFSLYLLAVQIFILKKACSWCMGSTVISALIFVLTILI